MVKTAWIGGDWGTSNLRCWGLSLEHEVLWHEASDQGMGSLKPHEFEAALLALVEPHLPTDGTSLPVLCCGMVGARQGWCEAPYSAVPCPAIDLSQAIEPATHDPRLKVKILPGLCQLDPADVMRGEETQIAGFLADQPDFEGAICLPGTHAKWVHIKDGKVQAFQTFMTGEVFQLLSEQSVLRHSFASSKQEANLDKEAGDQAFRSAVEQILENPGHLSAALFGLRAASLVGKQEADVAKARLSGLLVGGELAGAQEWWRDAKVVILGAPALSDLYVQALTGRAASVLPLKGEGLTLKGLSKAYARLFDWRSFDRRGFHGQR